MKNLLILISFISLLTINAQDNYQFEHLNIEDGLSQGTIYDILQDQKGFIWFCTDNGLNRYDGVRFKILKHTPDQNSITADRIYGIAQDTSGLIWLATDFGINSLDPQTNTFHNYFILPKDTNATIYNNVQTIYVDSHNRIWAGTNSGLYLYSPMEDVFKQQIMDDNGFYVVNKILEDDQDSDITWIGTEGRGLVKYNSKTKKHYSFRMNNEFDSNIAVNQINEIKNQSNRLLIGSNGGFHIFSKKTNQTLESHSITDLGYSFSSDIIKSIEIIDEDNIWVGSWNDGILIYDKSFNLKGNIRHIPNYSLGLSNNRITRLFQKGDGPVWIGTYSRGVNLFNKNQNIFRHYNVNENSKFNFTSNEVWSIYEDSEKVLWVCTDRGLNRFDRAKEKLSTFTLNNSPLKSEDVFSAIEAPAGMLWIGTRTGVNIYNLHENNFLDNTYLHELDGKVVLNIHYKKGNILWIGAMDGLYKVDIKRKVVIAKIVREAGAFLTANAAQVFAIEEANENELWIGTNDGLFLIDSRYAKIKKRYFHQTNKNSLCENRVYSLYKDHENILWIGTLGGGIDKFNFSDNTFKNFREYDGLANDVIYGIVEDDYNNLWISTNYGLSKFSKETETFSNYSISDGLQSLEFNYGAYSKSESGEIFFGGVNGFNSFFPKEILESSKPPEVVITDVLLLYTDEDGHRERNIDISYSNSNVLKLDYYENFLNINFAVLDYTNSVGNYYAYKIEEIHDNYIQNGKRHFVTFPNLEPGTYHLKVIGANSRSNWSKDPAQLTITISPPYWRSIIAYILYSLLLSTIIVGFYLWRQKTLRREIVILEKADRLKSEFLAQMSHEIRSPINVILSFSNLIRSELEDKVSVELVESFNSISIAGSRIIRTIDLILNMSEIQTGTYDFKPRNIDLHNDILQSLHDEFSQHAKSKNIKLILTKEIDNSIIYGDEYTITQIFANLIDNAIKYTERGSIRINIFSNFEKKILVEIHDTGKGMKAEYLPHIFSPFTQEEQGYTREFEGNGLGLALVKKYCDINNASVSVESTVGLGSTFTIVFQKYEIQK
ncbi:MAG: hypothetical protein KKA84_00440 [Bacteroidetes bacterium]|nr:hypothetical protein [Bacteroidota bacterium]